MAQRCRRGPSTPTAPMPEPAHPAYALPSDVTGEHRSEPVPPVPDRLMADVDPALEQQVLDVPQRQREANVHHDHDANDLWRRIEPSKWARRLGSGLAEHWAPL